MNAVTKTLAHTQAELLAGLEKLQNVTITVVGDIILDRYLWGSVERISQEAPVPVLDVTRKEDRLGGAANVARNLSALGLRVELCGLVGNDLDAEIVTELCKKSSIGTSTLLTDPARPTTVKTRVMASRQQVVRIDSEKKLRISGELENEFIKKIDSSLSKTQGLVISDYGKGVISQALMNTIADKQKSNIVSLAKLPLVLDPHPINYPIYKAVGVIKPNRKEAELASGIEIHNTDDAIEAAKMIAKRWQTSLVIITLGDGGMLLYDDTTMQAKHFHTLAQDVFDVSGAGDTVTALLSAGLSAKLNPALACALANIAARVAVSQVGTVAVSKERIREENISIF